MKLLSIVLLGLLSLTSRADILIYSIKVSATVTGHAQVTKSKVEGFVVIDPNTHRLADVSVTSASFHIFEFTATVGQIDAGKGKRYTAVSFAGNGTGSVMATGLNGSPLIAGTITNYTYPKSFKITGNEIANDLSSTEVDSGTLVFDQTNTVTENGTGRDFDETVSDIEQMLLGDGFIEN